MSAYSDVWGLFPQIGTAAETYENAFRWGPAGQGLLIGGSIYSGALDPGNTPTYELRPGLLLGQRTADGLWTNYSPTANDGSEVAAGVLITALRMQSILTGQAVQRFYGILIGGPVQAAKLINLDLMARADMSDHFWFDDVLNYPGNHWFPWKRFQTKTGNYQIAAADNFTLFDITGSVGAVTLTLPAIANGYYFGFRGGVAQNLGVTSTEGANMVTLNSLTSNSVTAQTGGQQIGAMFVVYSNPAGTKWLVENRSSATLTAA